MALSSLCKTYMEYSLAPIDDLIKVRSSVFFVDYNDNRNDYDFLNFNQRD